jgi:hypothetical protein
MLWEPARLQHVRKLLAHVDEKPSDQRARIRARDEIMVWIYNNPFPRGMHYRSVMECGLRIPVFVHALVLLDDLSDHDRKLIVRTVYEHAWLISRNLSLYSSLGNHTVCEAVGLVHAGAMFRDTAQGKDWLAQGIRLLDQELGHQVLEDGGPAEQSLSYHRFVLDLYWMAVGLLEKNGLHDCQAWKQGLVMGERFLAAFTDEKGCMPSIGDSDDGHAVAPGLAPERPAVADDGKPCASFPVSGYTIIRGKGRTRLVFDHGPLGMAPLYNHGHADALSVLLYKDDVPILVDPGTFRYNGVPRGRRYFKGTRAHNTVTVDGLDQAVQETGFIWSSPYDVDRFEVREGPSRVEVRARHNGYARLRDHVWHTRVVKIEGTRYTIVDTFEGTGVHDYELNFHLHPDAVAVPDGSVWVIRNSRVSCSMELRCGGGLMHARGQTDPMLGWYSPAYGLKRESPVLSCRKRGDRKRFLSSPR